MEWFLCECRFKYTFRALFHNWLLIILYLISAILIFLLARFARLDINAKNADTLAGHKRKSRFCCSTKKFSATHSR